VLDKGSSQFSSLCSRVPEEDCKSHRIGFDLNVVCWDNCAIVVCDVCGLRRGNDVFSKHCFREVLGYLLEVWMVRLQEDLFARQTSEEVRAVLALLGRSTLGVGVSPLSRIVLIGGFGLLLCVVVVRRFLLLLLLHHAAVLLHRAVVVHGHLGRLRRVARHVLWRHGCLIILWYLPGKVHLVEHLHLWQ
jgi:hypothetical protein